jgi:hypothetical protein
MTDKAIVSPLGNGEYRIMFPKPTKFDMNFILTAGDHKIRVLSTDKNREDVIGVEGEKQTLLSWLRSIGGIDEANMKSYEESMTE